MLHYTKADGSKLIPFDNLELTDEQKHFSLDILNMEDTSNLPDMPVFPIEYKNTDLPNTFDDLDRSI